MKSQISGKIVSDYKIDSSLIFIDFSIYNNMLPIDEPSLSILPPYGTQPVVLSYNIRGNTQITSIDLERSKTIETIPCGLYKIKQSICPHDKLNYEFWYVHVGQIKQQLAKLYCENKTQEAFDLSIKLDTLESLTFCKTKESEKKILAILDSLNCCKKDCNEQKPMNKIIHIPESCGCKKSSCKTCNK